jgi:uncharacterized membrane protein YhhN
VNARAWLVLFLVFAVADSVLAAVDLHTDVGAVRWATKPLLMPLLAAYVVAAAGGFRGLALPLTALAGGFVGDVGLLPDRDGLFMVGMAGFAVGHAAYIRAFALRGAGARIAANRRIPLGYAAAWAVMIAVLWRGLDDLLVPVIGYSLLLTAMAAFAAGMDRRTAIGGALFLLSDTVIACGIADLDLVPGQDAVVMPTYLAAQFLLMTPWTRAPVLVREPEAAAAPGSAAAF